MRKSGSAFDDKVFRITFHTSVRYELVYNCKQPSRAEPPTERFICKGNSVVNADGVRN